MEAKNTRPQLYKPGQGGRPKGVKNKITREIQAKIEWVLVVLDETIEEDLKKMKPPERIKLWVELQEFIRPKLQRVNLEVGLEDKAITKIVFEIVPPGLPGESIETKPE
jgi:hypothetical protein